jgi:hypothetical protein
MYISISAFYTTIVTEFETVVYNVNSVITDLTETVIVDNNSNNNL